MKKIVAFVLISVFCLMSLSSCEFKAIYDEVYSKGMEAQAMVTVFTTAIAEKNYEKAMANVHPDSDISAETLESIINSISQEHGIVFPQRVKFKIFSFECVADTEDLEFDENNATLGKLTIKYTIVIDGVKLKMEAVFLQNGNGFGIYTYSLK